MYSAPDICIHSSPHSLEDQRPEYEKKSSPSTTLFSPSSLGIGLVLYPPNLATRFPPALPSHQKQHGQDPSCCLPLSMYHLGLSMNSRMSLRIRSARPCSRTTEFSGRRRRGYPKGRHSEPTAVCITVFPSSCSKASARARREEMRQSQYYSLLCN